MKHKSDNQVKTVEKEEKADSFFNFFDPPSGQCLFSWFVSIICVIYLTGFFCYSSGTIADLSEEDRELLVADMDIGETLRHSVIPRAIIYFTGEGIDDDDEYDEEMDEEDFDEFDEDDDEEDEDEEEEEEESAPSTKKSSASKSKSAGGSRGKGGKGGKKEVPPECKQQ